MHRKPVVFALLLTLFLCLSFKTESLWTDEAFSAFMACHRTLSSLWQTLLAGDSSDLQMWLYYCYLHVWVTVFGDRELALRSANIPFILIYSFAIVWTRNNLFRSNWVYIAALSPFVWSYAADTRPYMSIISLSTVIIGCLIGSLAGHRSQALPWIALVAIIIGLNLHMLTVLIVPPALCLALTYRLMSQSFGALQTWIRPTLFLSPLFLIYFLFLAWTFTRGTTYDYAHPDLLSMGSVLFRFIGLAGFAPNRHYDVAFGPYIGGMAAGALSLIVAAVVVLVPAIRDRDARTISLVVAMMIGIAEALTLSLVFKQQIEVRHIACLFALLLFLYFSAWEVSRSRTVLVVSTLLVAAVWLVSDFRMTFLSEYKREDFRGAVSGALSFIGQSGSQIAVVADPAASAYYGLAMQGPSPCFPLPGECPDALAKVPWPRFHAAFQATFWTPQQIENWIQNNSKEKTVIISRSRHPMILNSAWWPALRHTRYDRLLLFHGFFVYGGVVQSTK